MAAEEQAEGQRLFDHTEKLLRSSGGPFLFGDVCLADLMLTPSIVRLTRHGIDLSQHPASHGWAQALLAHPAVSEWMEAADALPHIWSDEYLLPGAAVEFALDPGSAMAAEIGSLPC